MPSQLNYTVDLEDDVFIARCVELDITTDGLTREEAVANLKEALDCFFSNPHALLDKRLDQLSDDEFGSES